LREKIVKIFLDPDLHTHSCGAETQIVK
jgi:hypothetical protein